jgi:hypothetical protein
VAETNIPERVKAFIADHIHSLGQLEILLLLQRNPSKEFDAAEVAGELRIERSWASPRLADLKTRGILISNSAAQPKYRYEPNSPALLRTIDELASIYLSHRVSITTLIFAKPPEALRSFADAFRIRKERSDG